MIDYPRWIRAMDGQSQFSSPLEKAVAKIRKKEKGPRGKIQSWTHHWLSRLEVNPFFRSYGALLKKPPSVTGLRYEPSIDLDSLFLFSLLFHLILFFLLTRISFSPPLLEKQEPIIVSILDLGKAAQERLETKKETKKISTTQPLPSASPTVTAKQEPISPASSPAPSLPGPKALAEGPKEKAFVAESVKSLIQLPTRQSEGGETSLATRIDPSPASVGGEGYSLPEKLRRGETFQREAGTGSPDRAMLSSPDFAAYFREIERRVKAFWQYPEGVSGPHKVYLRFAVDRAGKLIRVEVLDSTDSKLDSGAVQAMKRASPFPPIPEKLKELAGQDLGIRFEIDLGVKGAR